MLTPEHKRKLLHRWAEVYREIQALGAAPRTNVDLMDSGARLLEEMAAIESQLENDFRERRRTETPPP